MIEANPDPWKRPGVPFTFELIERDMPSHVRETLGGNLTPAERQECWDRVREQTECRRWLEEGGPYPEPKRESAHCENRRHLKAVPDLPERDRLEDIPAEDYWPALTGDEVPNNGMVNCPLPDHEDRHPSCKVYGGNAGWFCHRCQYGGGVYQLGMALTGYGNRGEDFKRLRRWIAEQLLGRAAA